MPTTANRRVSAVPDLLEGRKFAEAEREARLTLAAVTLVGLQGYLQGLDQELFRHVTLAALRAAALRDQARSGSRPNLVQPGPV
jgi:hypothetical protein